MLIALFLWAIIAERILWVLFVRLAPEGTAPDYDQFVKRAWFRGASKAPASIEMFLEEADKMDQMLSQISSQPGVIGLLGRYGKSPQDVEDIFWRLMASGAGEYVAWSVIEDPKLLSEYLQMKADGVSDLEIMFRFTETLDSP